MIGDRCRDRPLERALSLPKGLSGPFVSISLLVALALLVACGGGGDNGEPPALTAAEICAATPDEQPPIVSSSELVEASGVASSRSQDGVFWAHNDSGDSARFFAFDRTGFHHATYGLTGAEALDWEDMAIGPGPDEDDSYLYFADIGDNDRARTEVYIYRVPEPAVARQTDTPTNNALTDFDKITLRYPDSAHDAETLLVDPADGALYIITKDITGRPSQVFRASPDLEDGSTATLEQVAEIDFFSFESTVQIPQGSSPLAEGLPLVPTGGEVSPDGGMVIVRTYGTAWVWERPADAPLAGAFAAPPCEAPTAVETQGEAIAFDPDGRGYFTVSEGAFPLLNHFTAQ